MKCTNCGKEIPDGSKFCKFCGTATAQPEQEPETAEEMQTCPSCHAPVKSGSLFCTKCGASLSGKAVPKKPEPAPKRTPSGGTPNPNRPRPQNSNQNNYREKKKHHVLPIVIVILIILAVIFFLSSKSSEENDVVEMEEPMVGQMNEEPEQTEEEEPAEQEAQKPSDSIAPVDSNGYAVFQGITNNFTCKYPSWFDVEIQSDDYLSCNSTDLGASMEISCYDANGNTPQDEADEFCYDYGPDIDYNSVSDSHFAIRTMDSADYYYKYGKLYQGKFYTFTLRFPLNELDKYDEMVNYIYDDFIKQFRS